MSDQCDSNGCGNYPLPGLIVCGLHAPVHVLSHHIHSLARERDEAEARIAELEAERDRLREAEGGRP